MAAKGKTMADSGYNSEVKSIQAFLSMQHPASQPVINPATLDIQIEEYVAPRFFRKMRSKVRSDLCFHIAVMYMSFPSLAVAAQDAGGAHKRQGLELA